MREWVLVPTVGGFGGFSTALIALWLRLERSPLSQDKRLHSAAYWITSMLINAFAGALASFFLWTTYTGADFSTDAAPTGVVGASLAVGVLGVGAVQRFLYVEDNLEESLKETAASNTDLQAADAAQRAAASIDSTTVPVHNAEGG